MQRGIELKADGTKEEKLTRREERLVQLLADGVKPADALNTAGYKPSESLNRVVSRPIVASALASAVRQRLQGLQGLAVSAVSELVQHADEDRVRLDAAKTVLNGTGVLEDNRASAPVTINIDLGDATIRWSRGRGGGGGVSGGG